MASDDLLATLAEAQRAPTDDYIVWASVNSRGETIDIPLETMRLPLSLDMEVVRERVGQRARKTLAAIGFDDEAIGTAVFR